MSTNANNDLTREHIPHLLVDTLTFNDANASNATAQKTYEEGTLTGSVQQNSSNVVSSYSIPWVKNGKQVTLSFPTISVTATAYTMVFSTAIPTKLLPPSAAASATFFAPVSITNNAALASGTLSISSTGVLTIGTGATVAAFTTSALGGINATALSYYTAN